ncbi:MAG: 3-hydroxyacyl-[acyl-carrier-protein] dehydratase FabA [Proteobacteria bacterium]|nr:3-hydroxyacyl-[acyl-carrier-protein] dehydratase FabA [Pseudomonadota bacterium]
MLEIAIVGQGCVLPGALSPEALWQAVVASRDCTSPVPKGRWGLSHANAMGTPEAHDDRTWSDAGGYVTGFEDVFDPSVYAFPREQVAALDPLVQWLLYSGREALSGVAVPERASAVIGNLSFPSTSMAAYAQRQWLGPLADALEMPAVDPVNRFMSGLPAALVGKALGLTGPTVALDAACASSLYALDVACKALADGDVDLALAGAVSRSDDLFIHVGFCALQAMSKSGRTRPFHAAADGLVPGEGAGLVALKRLEDARCDGDRVLGVIRGIGLSNDGRTGGFLAPSTEGQVRAIKAAYVGSGVSPDQVELVECHATGTPVGDGTELRSMRTVFAEGQKIGSLKSNLGHLITAAGVAGLIKVLKAFEHGQLPPTREPDAKNAELEGFDLITAPRPWTRAKHAAVSAFGFGGNNAHVVVSADSEVPSVAARAAKRTAPIAVVGIGALVGRGTSAQDFQASLQGAPHERKAKEVVLQLAGMRVPPKDLQQTHAQQLMVLRAAQEAVADIPLPRDRTSVLIGMGTDCEVARWGARWRAGEWGPTVGDAAYVSAVKDQFVPVLQASGVVGTMPNIPANRINALLDVAGPSWSLSAEEVSGDRALGVAMRELSAGSIDAAVVGAVDLSVEPVHQSALDVLMPGRTTGDGAVALVLMRLDDAPADRVLAVLSDEAAPAFSTDVEATIGHCHAATGLLRVGAAVLLGRSGDLSSPVSVSTIALMGGDARVTVTPKVGPVRPAPAQTGPLFTKPAHPEPVVLPSSSSTSTSASASEDGHVVAPLAPSSGVMAPAPSLPSVSSVAAPVVMTRTVPAPAPVVPVVPAAAPAPVVFSPPATPSPAGDILAEATRLRGQMAQVHAQFLKQQADAHAAFLKLRNQQAQTLLAAAGAAPVQPVQPVRAVQAPVVARPVVPAAPPVAPVPVVETRSTFDTPSKTDTRSTFEPRSKIDTPSRVEPPSKPTLKKPTRVPDRSPPTGPTWSREDLLVHASGNISEIFGPDFAGQDGFARQTRMPEPPLLLADRVVGLVAEPKSHGKGTIWTETDVTETSWYLHEGRMPAGVMIESGQADLMLISYLGCDFLNNDERIYRLLGCELTYHGGLPKTGETMLYDIHVDGYANQGAVRLFFFHYNCTVDGQPRLSVRGGQAGFFTTEELADSDGILWTPEEGDHAENPRLDAPDIASEKTAFSRRDLEAFADGRTWDCFGAGFEKTKTHTRTPRIANGRMLFLQEVTEWDPTGGPWGRGYLRAIDDITPEDWFFDGHFKNDPCMPGTLMFEGCLQAMALMMASMGFTVDRDGWRFEPIPEEKYLMRCRGQVTPTSRQLIYEVFIDEVVAGPIPMLFADLLCTVIGEDGTPLKAFHCRRMGLQLSPGWPMDSKPAIVDSKSVQAAICTYEGQEHRLDHDALVACAWGRPSRAFGPMYAKFDSHRKVPRLPGPPYHFCTRVLDVQGPMGVPKKGAEVLMAYEVPNDAWYFTENGNATMPYAVLLEAALQPCGWLASYVGCTLAAPHDLFFRNLDGTGTQHREVFKDEGTLVTTAKLTGVSLAGGMTIVNFVVETCTESGELVFDMKTVFGFFPAEALAAQAGIPAGDKPFNSIATRDGEGTPVPIRDERLPGSYLTNIGPVRKIAEDVYAASQPVDPESWYFRAHFCQDPVQPGSLGIEAMLQLLQVAMLDKGLDAGLTDTRFEPVALAEPLTWKYRGQVLPHNKRNHCTLQIEEVRQEDGAVLAIATASLWVDDMRIYEAKGVGMRLVGTPAEAPVHTTELDPTVDTWIGDHCPTYTVPALPMMYLVDRLVEAAEAQAEGQTVVGLRDVKVLRWAVVNGPTTLTAKVTRESRGVKVVLHDNEGPVCEGRVRLSWAHSQGAEALRTLSGDPEPNPYASGALFHGPEFQFLTQLVMTGEGSSSILEAGHRAPLGPLHASLVDAATHGIPHDDLRRWSADIPKGMVAYPAFIPSLDLHGPAPTSGEVRCEVRFAGFHVGARELPSFEVQLVVEDQVWCRFKLVEALFAKGPIGELEPIARRDFLTGRHVPEAGLSTTVEGVTTLEPKAVEASDWLPGTVNAVFGTDDPAELGIREHLGRALGVHPKVARDAAPLSRFELDTTAEGLTTRSETLDITPVREFWTEWFGGLRWPVEDLYYGLIQRFVRRVVTPYPEALAAVKAQSLLYLGNHQVGLESLLLSIVAGGLNQVPTVTLAKAEHRDSWLGTLIKLCFAYPGIRDPKLIEYFDRDDKASLPRIIGELGQEMAGVSAGGPGRSVMIHVEGTRSLECRTPVQKMSGAFLDMAMAVNAPVVPIRFVGALPTSPLDARIEFPLGMGQQDIWIGKPILPETLASMPYGERKKLVIAAINALGPDNAVEAPFAADPAFLARCEEHAAKTGASVDNAVLAEVLREQPDLCQLSHSILDGIADGDWANALQARIGTRS